MSNPITDYTLRLLCGERVPPANIVEQSIAAAFAAVGYGDPPPAPAPRYDPAPAPVNVTPSPYAAPFVATSAPFVAAPPIAHAPPQAATVAHAHAPPVLVTQPPGVVAAQAPSVDDADADDSDADAVDPTRQRRKHPRLSRYPDGKTICEFVLDVIASTKPGESLSTASFTNVSMSRYKVAPSSQVIQRGMHSAAAAGMATLDYFKLGQRAGKHAPGVQLVLCVTSKATSPKARQKALDYYQTLIGRNARRISATAPGESMSAIQRVAKSADQMPDEIRREHEAAAAAQAEKLNGADVAATLDAAPKKKKEAAIVFKSFNEIRGA
ncbi:MAG: hypothetical protein ACOYB0_08365 [Polynucleobacter sp.]